MTITIRSEIEAATTLTTAHVATLPDGSRLNLPVGTVLRAGMSWNGPPADPVRDLCDAFKAHPDPTLAAMILKLREQVDRGASPLLEQARELLRKAHTLIGSVGIDADHAFRHLSEIHAFLEMPQEATPAENFAALKRMAPSLAGTYERAATKHGIAPWNVTDEQLWEECPALRPGY